MSQPFVDIKVEGLDELERRMKALPEKIQGRVLRAAVSSAAKVVQDRAKEIAPVQSGVLQRSIYRARSRTWSSKEQETAIVGVRFGKKYQERGQDAWYWRLVEFGVPSRGIPAKPFLRPAFNSTKQAQMDALKERLSAAIERAVKSLGGSSK